MDEYIVVDLEMTGLKVKEDKIIEIGALHIKEGKVLDTLHEMVNPNRQLTDKIKELTHITQQEVDQGISQRQALDRWVDFAGDLPILGHNVSFDYSFLKQLAINEGRLLDHLCADTLKIARKCLPRLNSRSLDAMCQHYEIPLKDHHRALEDARATYLIYEKMKEEFALEHPEMFRPYPMNLRLKKIQPVTDAQRKQIKRLSDNLKKPLPQGLENMSRADATRYIEALLCQLRLNQE